MGKHLMQDIKAISALDAVALSATTNGIVIDTQGYESLAFTINVGDFATFDGTNNLTITVQEGDASNLSDAANIATTDYLDARNEAGAAWDRLLNGSTEDEQAYIIGVAVNTKRYKRIVVTEAGTVSVPISATAILGHPRHAPANVTQTP
jgi:hypothetical protein